ncbi:siphovirus Gp157 family protein [Limosilactobacillus fermentum]|uniref:siphovirus Gp157 family protein n=1 Tax=Limosilactobacillus fermentum TaxID=1613 RepID=UPI000FECAA82|nr:siphovirus Gp157 family protein [Limosilactobacillus fermentum]QAR22491.1 siphovirus Gp157 family protein [Limosilactobacillus fermentum]
MTEKLYELADKYKELSEREDLDPEVLHDTLDAINDAIEDKADNIAAWIDDLTSAAKRKKAKAKEWNDSAKADLNKADSLKHYLIQELAYAGKKKMETDRFLLSTRNNDPSTIIDDETLIPDTFKNTKVTESVDKTAIKEAIKLGKDVPGAHLQPSKSITIK